MMFNIGLIRAKDQGARQKVLKLEAHEAALVWREPGARYAPVAAAQKRPPPQALTPDHVL